MPKLSPLLLLVGIVAGCTGPVDDDGGDDCAVPLRYDTLDITVNPTEIELLPRDYRSQPARGDFGITNDEDHVIYVTPNGFEGDGADILSTSQQSDRAIRPDETLVLSVTYLPTPSLWQDGRFEADFKLKFGAFTDSDDAVTSPVAKRNADPCSWVEYDVVQKIAFTWDCDVDNDGFVAEDCGGDDCDDERNQVNPDADESCDNIDNDCNGAIDDDPPTDGRPFYQDNDGDGHGNPDVSQIACRAPNPTWKTLGDDCNDNDEFNFPGNFEDCDEQDNDCDGFIDEDFCFGDTDTDIDTDIPPLDSDRDGLSDDDEVNIHGTDPFDSDSDDDGSNDGTEVLFAGTDPNNPDTDGDGIGDTEERLHPCLSPLLADTDGDRVDDLPERDTHGTDPCIADTDRDLLEDGTEIFMDGVAAGLSCTLSPLDNDFDNDEVLDGFELLHSLTDPCDRDSDDDLLPDGTELEVWFTDPNDPDSDDDGLSDFDEVAETLTDPNDPDSDNDNLTDYDEVHVWGTNPNEPDTDGDGIDDTSEVLVYGSNPLVRDSDGDGLEDLEEVLGPDGIPETGDETDPNDEDSDGDGLTDFEEVVDLGTNPNAEDSDGDGLTDLQEVRTHLTDPTDADTDNDQLNDGDEIAAGTNPHDNDSDDDGLRDGREVNETLTDPLDEDSDDDTLSDGDEVLIWGSDPNLEDTDGDGLSDALEVLEHGSNPTLVDSDGDGLSDGDEVNLHETNPTIADSDGDDLDDGDEVNTWGSDPNDVDSDDDDLRDGREVAETFTSPTDPDSDDDDLMDGEEVDVYSTDPNDADSDDDDLTDGDEVFTYGTDPNNDDSDGDGLLDGEEVNVHGCDPALTDTDRDGLTDGEEIALHNTDCNVVDSDGDQVNDGDEVALGNDPTTGQAYNIRIWNGLLQGDLIITEVMSATNSTCDFRGAEYFEILNTTVDVWAQVQNVKVDTMNSFGRPLLKNQAPDFMIGPGERVLVVRKDNNQCEDYGPIDYDWDAVSALLDNFGDFISLRGGGIIDTVDWGDWSLRPLLPGASIELDETMFDHLLNDDENAWCYATTALGNGDFGTPGEVNTCVP